MNGMVEDRQMQNQKAAKQDELNFNVAAMLGESKGAYHHLLTQKAEAQPQVHQHIYQDGRSVNVLDARSSVDARSVDARSVNVHNAQHLHHQQISAAFNMQNNTTGGSSSSGGKDEEVLANSSKRPPGAPPGAGAIAKAGAGPQYFNISSAVKPAGPPNPPPPSGHASLHQIAANMLER